MVVLALTLLFACDRSSGGGGSSGGSSGGGSGSGGASSGASGSAGDAVAPKPAGGDVFRDASPSGPNPAPGITADQCTKTTDGGPLMDDTLTGVLKCGDKITGHTKGGVQRFDTKFYEKKMCTPGTTNHKGGDERIYRFEEVADQIAYITLDTPCANLDVAAIQSKDGKPPTIDSSVDRCEMPMKKGTKRERLDLFARDPVTWYIVVEGIDEEEGAFALTVDCFPWNK